MDSRLFDLLRAYAALVPVQKIEYPSDSSFKDVHDFVLKHILFNTHFNNYPPAASYQQSFWKWITTHLENTTTSEDDVIDDHYYEKLFDSMNENRMTGSAILGGPPPPPQPSFITHFWIPPSTASSISSDKEILDKATVTLFESRTIIEGGTTGLRTWRASFSLARYLISHPDLIQNANILELGSGSGFLGIVCASIQALCGDRQLGSSIYLTDINEEVLQRCYHNIHLPCNLSAGHPRLWIRQLDWSDALDSTRSSILERFLETVAPDVILGADVLYHPDIVPALLATIVTALKPRLTSCIAYLALTLRNLDLFKMFLSSAKDHHGLSVVEVSLDDLDESLNSFIEFSEGTDQEVKLLKITTAP